MQFPFRRAPATSSPAPMPMLPLPGKTPLGSAEGTSAAEAYGDMRDLMRCRGHLVQTYSDKKGAASVRADLLRSYVRHMDAVAPGRQHRNICFAWRDAGTIRRRTHTSLATERAVALFAMAVEDARVAAEEDRREADGIRRACAKLCDAAGLLQAAASERGGSGDHAAADCQLRHMSKACMTAFEALMLAQALECYFELAVAGGKPAALCSKVAQQVSLDYERAHRAMTADAEQHQIDRSFPANAQAKAVYFRGEACLRSARLLRESGDGDGVGEAIARLRQGVASLEGAKGALGRAAAPVRDAVKRLRKEVEDDLAAAEKDNCRIYFARLPTALPELPGLPQRLVRPTAVEKILLRGAVEKIPVREAEGNAAAATEQNAAAAEQKTS